MMPVGGKGGKPAAMSALARSNLSQQVPSAQHSPYYNGGKGNPTGPGGYSMMMNPQSQQWLAQQQSQQQQRYAAHMASGGKPMAYGQQRMSYGGDAYMMRQAAPQMSSSSYPYGSNLGESSKSIMDEDDLDVSVCLLAPPGYSHSHPMDPNAVAAARAGKPMLSHSQVPSRYPVNSYYAHPSSMAYQSQTQVPQTHRSLSQGPVPSPYSMPSTPAPSNGIAGKSNMVDPMDFKMEDTLEDPSKQQMFHPLLHSRSRPQTPSYYPNMQQPTNPPYYSTQRSMPGSPADYNMAAAAAAARGMRPANPYGPMAVQQRLRAPVGPPLSSSISDPSTGMTPNSMGLQSTPPPPSVTPR